MQAIDILIITLLRNMNNLSVYRWMSKIDTMLSKYDTMLSEIDIIEFF